MKSVHSHVLSSDPISLSDATSFLSSFNNSVCGGGGGASVAASHETCWFIRRALASFEELEQLHRKLKDRKSDPKSQNDDVETTVGDNPPQSFVSSRDVTSKPRGHRHGDVTVTVTEPKVGVEEGSEIAEVDKKKKEKGNIGNIAENGDGESEMGEVKREKKKKKKKKRDNVDENVGEIKEEKKKRKSEVLDNGEVDVSGEQQEKKKKKRRKS